MLQRLHLWLGHEPNRLMPEAYAGILQVLPYVRNMKLRIGFYHGKADDWEVSLLEQFLCRMPACSQIELNTPRDPTIWLQSPHWKVLVRGLGGGQGKRPWGSKTRVTVRTECLQTNEMQKAFVEALTTLSTLIPALSVQSSQAQPSNWTAYGAKLLQFQDPPGSYRVLYDVPLKTRIREGYDIEGFPDMVSMGLQIARLDLSSQQTGYALMQSYLISCRETLVSLTMADVDPIACRYFAGFDILPKLKDLRLVRMSTKVAESLLDSLRSSALHCLVYEAIKHDDLNGFLLGYLPAYFEAQCSLTIFDLHITSNSFAWSCYSATIWQLYNELQRLRRIKMTLNYTGSITMPMLQQDAFLTKSTAGLAGALRTMTVKLKCPDEVDRSGLRVVHFPNMVLLRLEVTDDTSEAFTLFSQFFRHFRLPALRFLEVTIHDPDNERYLQCLIQDVLQTADLESLMLQVNPPLEAFVPGPAITAFREACTTLGVKSEIHTIRLRPIVDFRDHLGHSIYNINRSESIDDAE